MAARLLKKRFAIANVSICLYNFHYIIENPKVNEWLKENDHNMDGRLNFKEFYKSLKSIMNLQDLDDDEEDDEDKVEEE